MIHKSAMHTQNRSTPFGVLRFSHKPEFVGRADSRYAKGTVALTG